MNFQEVINMYDPTICDFSYWWIFPIVMMILCFLFMRGRRWPMRCGFGFRDIDHQSGASNSALDILDRRYASGEINKAEYEEVKRTLTQPKPINPEQ